MQINLRITLPQHNFNPVREPIQYGDIESQVLDWIAGGLFPEESVTTLMNDGFGNMIPDGPARQGRFNPGTNRPRPAAESTRHFR